jgi:hypothetical protein
MPDSISVTIPDPKTDFHIGDLNVLTITIQNIDQTGIKLKSLVFMPAAGIRYVVPEGLPPDEQPTTHEQKDSVWSYLWPSEKSTVIGTIPLGKIPPIPSGNDVCLTFPFRAGGLFRRLIDTGKYTIAFVIKYTKDDGKEEYTKTVLKDITLYYHTIYMILGGIIGGVLGTIFRDWSTISKLPIPLTTLIFDILFGALIGFIIIIILQRKSNVQSFVSVNDAMGGILAGFIVGAAGRDLITSYLNVNTSTAASNGAVIASNVTPAI